MGDINNVLEVSFHSSEAGTPLTAAEVFDRGYSSLEQLIRHAQSRARQNDRDKLLHEQKAEYLFDEWMQQVPEDVTARVTTNEGVQEYRVVYRTNMHPNNPKIPNIIYLKDDEGTRYIVRDARKHECSTTRQVLRKHHNEINLKDYREGRFNSESAFSLIPEPNLILTFENLEGQGYPTILPPQKVISATTGRMLLIRDFLGESLRDSTFEPCVTGEYLGNLHAYGLIETLDRKIEHYFILARHNRQALVNIDPDVMLWSQNGAVHDHLDLSNFVKQVKVVHPMTPTQYMTEMKQIRAKILRDKKEEYRHAFLEALKETYG